MRRKGLLSLVFILYLLPGIAAANTVTFGDSSIYWPGFPAINDNSPSYGYPPDNSNESVGIPSLTGGAVNYTSDGNHIASVQIFGTSYQPSLIAPGDLFLDVGANMSWDYVVVLNAGVHEGNLSGSGFNVYKFDTPIQLGNSSAYKMTGLDNSGPWAGYDIRNNHPWALATSYLPNGSLVGTASFTGLTEPTSTFTFDDPQAILIGPQPLTIGWAVSCANDVIYETVPANVPEPSTMLLIGAGLVGLTAYRKRSRIA